MSELRKACRSGDLETVKKIVIKNHKDVNNPDEYDDCNNSPLMIACLGGHLNIVKYLLSSPDLKEYINIYEVNCFNTDIIKLICGAIDVYGDKNMYMEIMEYLIIEQNFKISEHLSQWLIKNEKKELLSIIQAQDLQKKLNIKITEKLKRKI